MQLTIYQNNMPKHDYDQKYFHLLKASLVYDKKHQIDYYQHLRCLKKTSNRLKMIFP